MTEVRAACTSLLRAIFTAAGSLSSELSAHARRNVAVLQRRLLALAHMHAVTSPTAYDGLDHTALAMVRGWYSSEYIKVNFHLSVCYYFTRLDII